MPETITRHAGNRKGTVPAGPGSFHCTVCQATVEGVFCATCGQRLLPKRITGLGLAGDLAGGLFTLERSLFANFRKLVLDPYGLVNNYWAGYRNYYIGPGRMLAIASLMLVLNFLINDGRFLGIQFTSRGISVNFAFLLIFLLLFTITSYITYLRFGRNFYEHVVMNIYNISLWTIIAVPVSVALHPFDLPVAEQIIAALFGSIILVWNARCFAMRTQLHRAGHVLLNGSLFMLSMYLLSVKN